ncbi:MAG: 1-acyl-sn-glycerol-3-phosphate acyltransferase, partial [Flavobacteriaceae bacterium]|nr:1-acyl-sn-glycerol-3-phosphate acyltransferase [Flavobacteriaceae bacterium]
MQKIISYPLTILFYLVFGLWLIIFQPIQWICYNIFGYNAHRWSVVILNFFLIRTTHILGTTYVVRGREKLPPHKPLIFVANHQSLYDIPPFIWFMRA